MKNRLFAKTSLIVLTLGLFLLTGCDLLFPENPDIHGTWDTGFGGTITITRDTYASDDSSSYDWDYSGDIIRFDNDSYNLPSENPSIGNFGAMLVKITAHKGDASQIGTFKVIRWKNRITSLGVTTVETSEGYKYGVSHTDGDEAWENQTTAEGFFSMYSGLTLVP